ncbi:hypothetical protein ACYJ1Y_16665 [Natrialbaceae archaeon A-gly3]
MSFEDENSNDELGSETEELSKIDRRGLIRTMAAGGTVPFVAKQMGTARAADCYEPYWAGEGDENQYDEIDYEDKEVGTGDLISDSDRSYDIDLYIDSSVYHMSSFENDDGDIMFQIGISAYGYREWDDPGACPTDQADSDGTQYQGTAIEVDRGSLYPNLDQFSMAGTTRFR